MAQESQPNPYSVHPGVLMTQNWVATLREKTGRSFDEWLRFDTGGFAKKDRITHRIPIAGTGDIEDEVRHWLKVAYEMDA